MITNTIIKKIKNIIDKLNTFLEDNFSEKVVDILEVVLYFSVAIVIFYLFFIAFTEILLFLLKIILLNPPNEADV